MSKEWDNETSLNLRTKLALKILLLMVKVIAPYQFANKFETELEAIDKLIYGTES